MKTEILHASESNLDAIADLYCECFNAPEKNENWDRHSTIDFLNERAEEQSYFMLTKGEQDNILGLSIGCPFDNTIIARERPYPIQKGFYLSVLAIRNHYQGRGLGQTLMCQSILRAREKGFHHAVVRCRASNKAMRHILKKEKFSQIDEYESALGGVRCNRLVYLKDL